MNSKDINHERGAARAVLRATLNDMLKRGRKARAAARALERKEKKKGLRDTDLSFNLYRLGEDLETVYGALELALEELKG